MNINKEPMKRVINGLQGAFIWSESEEGYTYWKEVLNKLEKYDKEL